MLLCLFRRESCTGCPVSCDDEACFPISLGYLILKLINVDVSSRENLKSTFPGSTSGVGLLLQPGGIGAGGGEHLHGGALCQLVLRAEPAVLKLEEDSCNEVDTLAEQTHRIQLGVTPLARHPVLIKKLHS